MADCAPAAPRQRKPKATIAQANIGEPHRSQPALQAPSVGTEQARRHTRRDRQHSNKTKVLLKSGVANPGCRRDLRADVSQIGERRFAACKTAKPAAPRDVQPIGGIHPGATSGPHSPRGPSARPASSAVAAPHGRRMAAGDGGPRVASEMRFAWLPPLRSGWHFQIGKARSKNALHLDPTRQFVPAISDYEPLLRIPRRRCLFAGGHRSLFVADLAISQHGSRLPPKHNTTWIRTLPATGLRAAAI